MSPLDHFAMAAMSALIAAKPDDAPDELAKDAYLIARAMVQESARQTEAGA